MVTPSVGTNLSHADLVRADLRDARLDGGDLTEAVLGRANLERAQLVGTALSLAQLSDARVHGVAAWDLHGEPPNQQGLVVTGADEAPVAVDDQLGLGPTSRS